jgi:CBS domain-containing protein
MFPLISQSDRANIRLSVDIRIVPAPQAWSSFSGLDAKGTSVDTSAISYRVADFLKKHPPFQAMQEGDLLELAARGRVRFHEANEYILWQGEPHKLHVFVIQQGTVSLWDEADGRVALRDVRGAGDMLGIERFADAPCCLHSARSASDVVLYSFPASDFQDLVLKYPYARHFVESHETVTADYQWANDTRDPQKMFLHDVVGGKATESCNERTSIRDVAQSLLTTGSDAIAVVDGNNRVQALVTVDSVLAWVAAGAGHAEQPITGLLRSSPPPVGPAASVVDGVLAIAEAEAAMVAVTSDGFSSGQLHALVTARDVARVFGDQPISILREIRLASSTRGLRELNHRARAFALQYLTSAASLDWLARFVFLTDVNILKRTIALAGGELSSACWCFCGASGRGESLTRHAPQLVVIVGDESERLEQQQQYERVAGALTECDYLDRIDMRYDRSFHVASTAEWHTRYLNWLRDPVRTQMYLARPLFDLRPVHGREALWHDVESTVAGAVDRDLLHVLANDCLASLPPLTFFQDAVVEESGEHTAVFRLEHSALQPLVDVGRVFGMAANKVLGTSTLERFALARTLLPEHESIFREAAETLRILLWQQARLGIGQGTTGSELPPALLSRHDRHVLKSGFRSILRLLEFTGNSPWFATL